MLKSKNVWASIVRRLLHLTMIGTKKHGVRSKNKLGPFSLHDASRCSLTIPIKIKYNMSNLNRNRKATPYNKLIVD